jgi:SAM-dependent methyltransferase
MQYKSEPIAAFDATAEGYDDEFSLTAVGKMQRSLVWDFLKKYISPYFDEKNQKTALELNCGTGEDALWLAQNGWKVTASDLSSRMVQVTQRKAEAHNLVASIRTKQLGFHQISELNQKVDLIFSNFGGLNCISSIEIGQLGLSLTNLLKPEGYFVAVIMGRFCWWEILYFLIKGKWKSAFRRFSKDPIQARLDDNTFVATWYYTPATFLHALNQQLTDIQYFEVVRIEAIGFWLPPSYLDNLFNKLPFLLGILHRFEQFFRGKYWTNGADHFLICVKVKNNLPNI